MQFTLSAKNLYTIALLRIKKKIANYSNFRKWEKLKKLLRCEKSLIFPGLPIRKMIF